MKCKLCGNELVKKKTKSGEVVLYYTECKKPFKIPAKPVVKEEEEEEEKPVTLPKEAVKKAYELAKKHGVQTAYDPNYSSTIHTPETAKENFNSVIENVDILFMSTKYDTKSILDTDSIENIMKNIWDKGVSILVLKSSEKGGYYTGYNGSINFTEFYTKEIVDTTCSGDAFNGAFMYGLTHGYTPMEASKLASVVAGLQAKGIGAIKSVPYAREVFQIFKKG